MRVQAQNSDALRRAFAHVPSSIVAGLWLDVTLNDQPPARDHTIALLRVNEVSGPLEEDETFEPIIYHRSSLRTLVAAQGGWDRGNASHNF